MNDKHRNRINAARIQLEQLIITLDNIHSDAEEAYENIPDSLRDTDAANESYDANEELRSIVAALESEVERLEELSNG